MRCKILILLFVILLLNNALAHGGERESLDYSLQLTSISLILIILLISYSLYKNKLINYERKFLFMLISLITLATTFYLAYSTISLNVNSITKGPVHWHADFDEPVYRGLSLL